MYFVRLTLPLPIDWVSDPPKCRVVRLPEMTDDRSNPRDVRDMLTEYSKKDPLNSFYIFKGMVCHLHHGSA